MVQAARPLNQKDAETEYLRVLQEYGLDVDSVITDGEFHDVFDLRYETAKGKKAKKGWYVYNPEKQSGSYGSHWRGEEKINWRYKSGDRNNNDWEGEDAPETKARQLAMNEKRQSKPENQELEDYLEGLRLAINKHDYLAKKDVYLDNSQNIRIIIDKFGNQLIVPYQDIEGKLTAIQHINNKGVKRNMKGSKTKKAFHPIGTLVDSGSVFITEGLSTGMTVHEAMERKIPVVVAGSATNLEPVAVALRKKYPQLNIIIAGDKDSYTDTNNVGENAAKEAAKACNGSYILPAFDDKAIIKSTDKLSDFNDLMNSINIDKVREQLQVAMKAIVGLRTLVNDAFNGAELKNTEILEPAYIVDKVLPEGLTLLASRPKIGKTVLFMNLALEIVAGDKALGNDGFRVKKPGDVLFISLEDRRGLLRKRQKIINKDLKLPDDTLEHIHYRTVFERNDIARIEKELDDNPNIVAVFIDTLERWRPPMKGQQTLYSYDYESLHPLHELAGNRGLAVVVAHHVRKMDAEDWIDQISGSTGLTAAADTIIGMFRVNQRGSTDAGALLKITGKMGGEDSEVGLESDYHNFRWKAYDGPVSDLKLTSERKRIVDVIRQEKRSLTIKEIADLLEKNYDTVRTTVNRMCDSGELAKSGSGKIELGAG